MRQIRAILSTILLALPLSAAAQITYNTITGTVTDQSSIPLAGAQFAAVLVSPAGFQVASAATPNGSLFNGSPAYTTLDSTGHFSIQLMQNGLLHNPGNSKWSITISAPQDSSILTYQPAWNLNYQFAVTGDADLSTQLSSLVTQKISFINMRTNQSSFVSAAGLPINNPVFTGALAGPTLGGLRYASQWQTGGGNNGITNAAAANQFVVADPSYSTAEQYSFQNMIPNAPSPFHFQDLRQGVQEDFFHNWSINYHSFYNVGNETAGHYSDCLLDSYPANLLSNANGNVIRNCEMQDLVSSTPGWSYGNPPSTGFLGWDVEKALTSNVTIYGAGISSARNANMIHFGVGDTVADYMYAEGHGGWTAPSDEGTKAFGAGTTESWYHYLGTCTTGCTTGSTLIKTTIVPNISAGQGVGRYVIDSTAGPTFTTTVSNLAAGVGVATAVTVAATVPVSNAWGSLAANCGPANKDQLTTAPPFSAPYTCNVNVTSGTFDNSHLLCFSSQFHECVTPTAVGAVSGGVQSVTFNLRRPHASGGTVFQGGMAGNGLEFTSFTMSSQFGQSLQYLFDIVGSTDSHTVQAIYYKQGSPEGIIGHGQISAANIYGFFNITSLSNSGTTVSGTFISAGSTLAFPWQYNLGSFAIAGASDSVFNTTCTNFVWTSQTAFTCTIAGLVGSHTAATATASLGQSGVKLWAMAEVIDVQNETTTPPTVDGTLALEPNNIPIAAGHVIEELHHASGHFSGMTSFMSGYNPYNVGSGIGYTITGSMAQGGGASVTANGLVSLSSIGGDSNYIGLGGRWLPLNGVNIQGPIFEGLNFDHAPFDSLINLGLTSAQNNDQNFAFHIFNIGARLGNTQWNLTPYSGNTAFITPGVATWAAISHTFVGAVALPSSSTIAGNPIAPTVSPAFTGVPTTPTPAPGINTTQIANMAAIKAAVPSSDPSSSQQIGQISIGGLQNYIQNSTTMTGTGWAGRSAATGTGGQTDPYIGTNAVQIALGTLSDSAWENSPTSQDLVSGTTYVACGWLKGAAGGEQVQIFMGGGGTGSLYGPTTLTTAWQSFGPYSFAPTTLLTTTFSISNYVAGAQTVYAYGWSVVPGTTCPAFLPTTSTAQTTPIQVASAPVMTLTGATDSCNGHPIQAASEDYVSTCGGVASSNGTVQTASFTMTSSGTVQMNCAGACNLTLPASPATGFSAGIISIGAGAVTILPNGHTNTGVTTLTQGQSLFLFWDGTNFDTGPTTTYGSGLSFTFGVTGNTVAVTNPSLAGLSGSIGGSALTAGQCSSGTVSITGVTAGMAGIAEASDGTYQAGYIVQALGTGANTATVELCAIAAGNPTAKTYNVRIIK